MFLESYSCVLCAEEVEEFDCPFAQFCWIFLGIQWDNSLLPLERFILAKQHFGCVTFREVMIIACCTILEHRNSIIFNNGQLSFTAWLRSFEHELKLVVLRAKPTVAAKLTSWLSSLFGFNTLFALGLGPL